MKLTKLSRGNLVKDGENMSFYSARKKAGLSQDAVAKQLGVSSAAVCQWETGKTEPRAKLLPKIANAYGCTIDDLLTDSVDTATTPTE